MADDWKYVAMVLDRILLWVFTVACVVGELGREGTHLAKFAIRCLIVPLLYFAGTAGIIMAAPSHYDARQPIDVKYSKVDRKTEMRRLPDEE